MKRILIGTGIMGTGIMTLIFLILPNFTSIVEPCLSTCRTKANMYMLQSMIETYGVEWRGVYPENVQILADEMTRLKVAETMTGYNHFFNPYTKKIGVNLTYTNENSTVPAGYVSYLAMGTSPIKYYIYGYDKKGKRIQYHKQDFFLTNS